MEIISRKYKFPSWTESGSNNYNATIFERFSFWLIWLSVWFSPVKIDIGLNLSIEFLAAYLLFVYQFFMGRITTWQIISILCLSFLTLCDFMRTDDFRSFMFLGFLIVNIAFIELARSNFYLSNRVNYFILAIPIVAICWRFLVPESGGISGYDEAVVGGEVVQRFNILGYESNALSSIMGLLLAAVLSGLGNLGALKKLLYLLFCIAITLMTFSRTGLVSAAIIFFVSAFLYGSNKMILIITLALLGLLITQVTELTLFFQTIFDRMSALNLFEDERGLILLNRLNHLASNIDSLVFGVGFMHYGASDNTLLSLVYGYGLIGFIVILFLSITSIGAPNKLHFKPRPIIVLIIAMAIPLLTGDVFGQAKTIGCFYILIIAVQSINQIPRFHSKQ
jgi:hypothetical protein